MFSKVILLLAICCSALTVYARSPVIKSLKAFSGADETSFPVLVYEEDSSPSLKIIFDVDADMEPSLSIVFRFCDKNWKPYTNLMLTNSGENTYPYLDFSRLPSSVEGARYHFEGSFPDADDYVTFPFSGKWRYYITESNDTSVIYAEGKFFVIRDPVKIRTSLKKEILETQVLFPADLAKVFNITVDFTLPDELFPFYVQNTEIVENQKISYPYIVGRQENSEFKQFYWDGSKRFSFTSKEIKPGNEYRQTDLRNANVYNRKDVKAQIPGPDISRFFQQGRRDLNGASVLSPFNDEYSEYLEVEFNLRAPSDFRRDVLVTGAFNNWVLDPAYKLNNSGGYYSGVINMKRGLYDYQYVAADVYDDEVVEPDWLILEGNNWTTQNMYHVFVYYQDQNYGGYDRIIGYSKILSK